MNYEVRVERVDTPKGGVVERWSGTTGDLRYREVAWPVGKDGRGSFGMRLRAAWRVLRG